MIFESLESKSVIILTSALTVAAARLLQLKIMHLQKQSAARITMYCKRRAE